MAVSGFLFIFAAEKAECLKSNYQKQTIMKKLQMAVTKADKMVIRVLVCVIIACAAVVWLTACSPVDEPAVVNPSVDLRLNNAPEDTTVTIHFTEPQFTMEPMSSRTRATLSSSGMTHLDLWLSDGETTTDIHQTSSDANYGTVTTTLNKLKTYTLYAIAHKAAEACTLTNGIIVYPDDKVKESFFTEAAR